MLLDELALQKILNDANSTDAERATARRQLDALNPKSAVTDAEQDALYYCGPYGPDLLRFSGAHEPSEVGWRSLIEFSDSIDWPGKWENQDLQKLWRGWIVLGIFRSDRLYFKDQIWSDIRAEFATHEERRAEFELLDRAYPLFDLMACDDPYELESYERSLDCRDRNLILAITRKKLDAAPEYAFRTHEVAQRIIDKLTERVQLLM